jgi:hypothetical protein
MAQPPEGQKSIKMAIATGEGADEEDKRVEEFVRDPLRMALINDLCDVHGTLFEEIILIRRYLLRFADRIVEQTVNNPRYEAIMFLELEYHLLDVLSIMPKHSHSVFTTGSIYGGMRDMVKTVLVNRREQLMRPGAEKLCVADEAENKRKETEEKDGDGKPSKEVKAETTSVNVQDKE